MLDPESVRLFVLVVDFGNLTRAAEAAGTVQPVVSQRLRQLEQALGRKLLERTSRFVRLTPDGAAFLPKARLLLGAHKDAAQFADVPGIHIALGLSDHAIGTNLKPLIGRARDALLATSTIEVHMGMSQALRTSFDEGKLDAIVIRRELSAPDGEVLRRDPLGWRAHDTFTMAPDAPVPLITLGPPCGVRALAIRSLEDINRSWREVFVGASCAMLIAAAETGLGVVPMGSFASDHRPDRGRELGLPSLSTSEIVLFGRVTNPTVAAVVRSLQQSVGERPPE